MDRCCATKPEKLEQRKVAIAIDEELKRHKKSIAREIKLLLLGAGDSGKSTIAKQFKIIHSDGFVKDEERKQYIMAVLGNIITCIQALLRAVETCGYKLPANQNKAATKILELNRLVDVSQEMRESILELYNCKTVQKTLKRRQEYYLPDSAPYFFEHLNRILEPNAIPTVDDILRTRIRTMGVYELPFTYNKQNFLLVDVGGQRSERRKWIHCFQDVTSILFCVALSEYNLALEEASTVNRMHESLQLFKEICQSEYFRTVSIILFLNKQDIFQEKIKTVGLGVCFPEYKGGLDYDQALKFIKEKFESVNKDSHRGLYTHVTVATNTENIRFVFDAVKDTFIETTLAKQYGAVSL